MGKSITCIKGDITESGAEAIVNAANNHLWMGSGVAGAIKRKGGEIIEREAMAKGPIPIGEAVATGAGKLPQRYIIHAAAMGQDLITDREKVGAATRNAMLRGEELGIKTIAFPAIGTGVGGFPMESAAQVMVETVMDFLKRSKSLSRVEFILFDNEAYKIFKRELSKNPED
jgi:O-acetyl-ADP-ribose deacetylase (regulator of RNase III)